VTLNKAKPGLTFPAAVETVVMKALAKAPAERYPSVKAFSDAFETASTSTATASGSAPSVSGSSDAVKKEGGLFGKMKGLFGR
jgi:serine/threonine-protein kinase